MVGFDNSLYSTQVYVRLNLNGCVNANSYVCWHVGWSLLGGIMGGNKRKLPVEPIEEVTFCPDCGFYHK